MSGYLAVLFAATLSAVLPISPIEPYLVGLAATGHQTAVPLSIAAAAGQSTGKLLVFLGARAGLRTGRVQRWYAWATRRIARVPDHAPAYRWPTRWRRAVVRPVGAAGRRLTAVLDRPACTAPVVFVSAVTGVPPLLATSVYAARTPIAAPLFTLACLLGRSLRFLAITSAPLLFIDQAP
ncbi:hypothetical protein EV385_5781 [Krasilnikovia cinnamomea]|uniref:Membrane protein YqaA with SNARE-associated domain n=1 Tax=Krasilnikovia cinnamomea TaxID=349313 RepID=A0A4Q7ZRR8_9ACTN|nr:hypothetical protein [Krasilnikovia cinnamomea]RZU53847.1 hypothetical protein EV385_5781 [Krasilnikovia cinnamomea]